MKTTIVRIQKFISTADQLVKEYPENEKAAAVIRRMTERVSPCFQEYHKLWADIKLALANTDKNGSLLYDPTDKKEFAYTKEGYKELQKQTLALQNEDRFEFEPIIIDSELIPEKFHSCFEGFIISRPEVEE